jgi:hypothetical protein
MLENFSHEGHNQRAFERNLLTSVVQRLTRHCGTSLKPNDHIMNDDLFNSAKAAEQLRNGGILEAL